MSYKIEEIPLHETAQERYLNYAMSVITSRALPDVRDGLKPVQRRILYTMFNELRLSHDQKHRKSAAIVGDCFVRGTLVSTPGGLRPIEALEEGDEVYTQRGVRRVTQSYVMPPKALNRVHLRDGRSISCTRAQRFKVLDEDLQIVWREAQELAAGDYVVCRGAGQPAESDAGSGEVVRVDGVKVDTNFAWLLGYSLSGQNGRCANDIVVPDVILERAGALFFPFLSGFLDGSGSVNEAKGVMVATSTHRPFLESLQTVLCAFGVYSRCASYFTEQEPEHHAELWSLELGSASLRRAAPWLELRSHDKDAALNRIVTEDRRLMKGESGHVPKTLERWEADGVWFEEVVEVEQIEPEVTYDIQVEGEHEFIANGVLVHNCMGKFHPHGDQSIYDAMVRMAQDFNLRYPMVDGQGNFGSLDGDSAAAMRYTEARLAPLADELLSEIRKKTVAYRPNYDATLFEPVVLPAQVPNLLINGATGIAVGMATNIPPHNLGEVVDALIALIDRPSLDVEALVDGFVNGPDFPTGGVLLESPSEIKKIYNDGSGTFTLRADWELEKDGAKKQIVVTSVPFTVNKASVVEKIAEHIVSGKLPQLVDVRDESTEEVRIVLELKKGASHAAAMAYLFKHTPLQHRFHTNLTCLVPTDNPQVCAPARLDLKSMLQYFLEFRMEVLTKRTEFDLQALRRRIHLLEGFEIIFDALDEAIALIRASEGKKDAREKLIERFALDQEQADAILDTRLYRIAKLEIQEIRDELATRRAEAAKLEALLASESKRWTQIKRELRAIRSAYGDTRRTRADVDVRQFEYSEENYIIDEEVRVIVTRDGWFKRQKSYSDLSTIRVRDGDEVRYVMPATTRGVAVFFSNLGRAYTIRVDDIPSTSGYGDPIQASFDFSDGERIVGMMTDHPEVLGRYEATVPEDQLALIASANDVPPSVHMVAISEGGLAIRFTLDSFEEPSTVRGRAFMKIDDGERVVNVEPSRGDELVSLASRDGRGLTFKVDEISTFKGVAKGVKAIALEGKDTVLDFTLSSSDYEGLDVETNRGARQVVRASLSKFAPTSRGNIGRWIIKRGHLIRSHRPAVEIVPTEEGAEEE